MVAMVISAVLTVGLATVFGTATPKIALTVAGVIVVFLDLLYRFKAGEGDVFHPRKGGQVFWIPLWIWGGLWSIGALCGLGADALENSTRPTRPVGQARPGQTRQVYARSAYESPGASYQQRSAPGSRPASSTASAQQLVLAEPERTFEGLKVAMISGAPGHMIATINGEPFSEGETHKLTLGDRRVTIQCVEIRDQAIVAKIQGEAHVRLLKVGQMVYLSDQ